MDIGLALFPTDYTIAPPRVAQLAEERGFSALLFPEHTHIPVSRETPYPGGGELPPEYSHTHDLFVAMAMAAAVTERIEVGSGVCLVPQHDPIITANAVASIDALSGGRVLFGVGAGWNREEMREPRHRPGPALQAHARAHRGDEGDLDGGRGRVPRRVRRLRPDLVLAQAGAQAASAGARRRHRREGARPRLAYGDGWMPNRVTDPEALGKRIEELRDRAGRRVPVSVFGAKPDAGFLERLAAVGVDRALLYLTPREPEAVERQLDGYTEFL